MKNKILMLLIAGFAASVVMPSCKAKTCDTANNIDGDESSKKRKKNLGLFSKKEMRRKRYR